MLIETDVSLLCMMLIVRKAVQGEGGYIGILCTSIQIFYELKTALKVKVCVKNYISLPSWPFTLFAISLLNVLYES